MLQFQTKFRSFQLERSNDKDIKSITGEFSKLLKSLEVNFIESQNNDRLLLLALRMDAIEKTALRNQLHEAVEENRQLLNVVQLRTEDNQLQRGDSKLALNGSFSTTSLVHMQYKYEELHSNYAGLLKVLEVRNNELKKYLDANTKLQENIQTLRADLEASRDAQASLARKIEDIKRRKREKVLKLKTEKSTLATVHNRLVALLHRQCMEKNDFINIQLKTTGHSDKGLLLQEIRRNNILTYENFQLQQELESLRAFVSASRSNSKESVCVNPRAHKSILLS